MRGENPQLTNLPRRGYNMFQSNDGEGRRPAPSESRRAVEAGGKGLQRNADRIFVIDRKGILEDGNHEELMKKQGAYYELYRASLEQ